MQSLNHQGAWAGCRWGTQAGQSHWADESTELGLRKYFLMEIIAEAFSVSKEKEEKGPVITYPQTGKLVKETRIRQGQDLGNGPNFGTEPQGRQRTVQLHCPKGHSELSRKQTSAAMRRACLLVRHSRRDFPSERMAISEHTSFTD